MKINTIGDIKELERDNEDASMIESLIEEKGFIIMNFEATMLLFARFKLGLVPF